MTRPGVALGLAACWLAPRIAEACGETPPPYTTIAENLPSVRTGLPRDGAVVVRGKVWDAAGWGSDFASLRLLDDAGNVIPAARSVWWRSEQPSMAIAWASPLPARTRVTVEALAANRVGAPAGADGPLATKFTFETGDELARPLTLAGPMRVQLEAFDADVLKCPAWAGTCGRRDPGCDEVVGKRRALRARITVPAASGGVDFDGYRGWVRFSADNPAIFSGPGEGGGIGRSPINLMTWLDVRPGVETEIFQEVFDEDAPYAPCFALNLWDPAGHAVQAPPVCLPKLTPSKHLLELDHGGGCSAAAGRGGGAGAGSLAIGLALLTLGRRRRTSRG